MTSATHREESNASPGTSQYKFQQLIQADLASGRTIGNACECEGVYHFDDREVVKG
ncbi:hypothetical protein CK203_116996 [Vitis vinifera]|uniref:Uncharacterized protein n=1 Tax=Vitis vinifera TaxID=29760 RepID=A0A438D1H3_VITVI|nr:hypothetical protein CK203_116996 [Vitis vinifera]